MITGIDVSKWQGKIDWAEVAGSGQDFAVIRAGYANTGADEQFDRNREQAEATDLVVGFYWAAYPTRGDGRTQADGFCGRLGTLGTGQFVAVDIEDWPDEPLPDDADAWTLDFVQRVESRLGVKALVYMDWTVHNRYGWDDVIAGDHGLWLAYYDGKPEMSVPSSPPLKWSVVAMKQYEVTSGVPGISGDADRDVFNGTRKQLEAYGA